MKMDVAGENDLNASTTEEVVESETSIHDDLKDLAHFKVEKVLFNNSNRKTLCLQGTFDGSGGDPGIVLLEKTPFEQEQLQDNDFYSEKTCLKKVFQNDIYGNYECFPIIDLNAIKTTIIHPATEKHIQKFTVQTAFIVDETPEIYRGIVLPHLSEEKFNLQWVYNILEHTAESERIVFEDPDAANGFILLPDLKWDGKTLETLYLLAITQLRDIKSLRDLKVHHLDLLRNIKTKGSKAIQDKYGLDPSRLRIYLHYHPSFYHLHVHFTYLQYEAPGIHTERSHLLSNVISNIEITPDYYEKVTIPFVVREFDKLFKKLVDKDILKPADPIGP